MGAPSHFLIPVRSRMERRILLHQLYRPGWHYTLCSITINWLLCQVITVGCRSKGAKLEMGDGENNYISRSSICIIFHSLAPKVSNKSIHPFLGRKTRWKVVNYWKGSGKKERKEEISRLPTGQKSKNVKFPIFGRSLSTSHHPSTTFSSLPHSSWWNRP